jgi:hypothetical protein
LASPSPVKKPGRSAVKNQCVEKILIHREHHSGKTELERLLR